uniref:Uncharacterized protein n=1 Tax=Scleropages formosus TaxID=113540 RepID=A0A8C9V479_SCLFO
MELVTLAQAATLLAGGCQATHLSVLVHRLGDPLRVGVASDGLVERVNEDDLKELVCGIFAYPVGVEDSQSTAMTTSTLLSIKLIKFFKKLT